MCDLVDDLARACQKTLEDVTSLKERVMDLGSLGQGQRNSDVRWINWSDRTLTMRELWNR